MPDQSTEMRIRTVVVDDEPPARRLLASLVRSDRDLELVGQYATGATALAAYEEQTADLILLDVQMPGLDGISFVECLPTDRLMPYIVFVTAHDGYAITAFELNALDYLLKPIEKNRFRAAIERAKKAIRQRRISDLTEQMYELAQGLRDRESESDPSSHLIVRKGDQVVDVDFDDIVWVEAANQYVKLHTLDQIFLIAENLSVFAERKLTPKFVRVHRSAIVNPSQIVKVMPQTNGTHRIALANGDIVSLARGRKELLPRLLRLARPQRRNGVGC